jgi:hypothetical protein
VNAAIFLAENSDDPRVLPVSRQPDGPVLIDLRDVEVEDTAWLVADFLPAAQLTILQGHGGAGKGTLMCRWAAELSRTGQMVFFAVAEDAYATAVKPRLLAAGADLAYVRCLEWRRNGTEDAVTLPDDIQRLGELVQEHAVKLLIVDPILSHLSGKTDSYKDHEVKRALRPLAAMATRTVCTVCGVHHFTKDTAKGAVMSGQASGAFSNTARLVLAMAHDKDEDTRVLEVVKSNVSPIGVRQSFAMQLVNVAGMQTEVPILVPDGTTGKSVNEILAAERQGTQAKRVPAKILRDLVLRELGHGEQTRKHLDEIALDETGANPDSVYKSALDPLRKEGLIKARKSGFEGGFCWHLTTNPDELG